MTEATTHQRGTGATAPAVGGCERERPLVGTGQCGLPTSFVYTCMSCHHTELLCPAHAHDARLYHMITVIVETKEAGGERVDVPCDLDDGVLGSLTARSVALF